MAKNGDNLQADDWMRRDDQGQGRHLILIALGLAAVLAIGAAVYALWFSGSDDAGLAGLPTFAAPEGPDRVEPDDPGGLNVPHRDKLVYDRLTGEHKPRVEHLLPEAEKPMDRDQIAELIERDQTPAEKAAQAPASNGSDKETADAASSPTMPAPKFEAKPAPKPAPTPALKPAPIIEKKPDPAPEKEFYFNKSDWLLQLAAFRTRAGAEKAWRNLQKNRANLLNDLKADFLKVEVSGKGTFHRLRVGPFTDKASASARCDQLKAVKQDCLIIAPRK